MARAQDFWYTPDINVSNDITVDEIQYSGIGESSTSNSSRESTPSTSSDDTHSSDKIPLNTNEHQINNSKAQLPPLTFKMLNGAKSTNISCTCVVKKIQENVSNVLVSQAAQQDRLLKMVRDYSTNSLQVNRRKISDLTSPDQLFEEDTSLFHLPQIFKYVIEEDPNCLVKKRFDTQADRITKYHIDALHNFYIPNVNGNWDDSKHIEINSISNLQTNNGMWLNVVPKYGSWITNERIPKNLSHIRFTNNFKSSRNIRQLSPLLGVAQFRSLKRYKRSRLNKISHDLLNNSYVYKNQHQLNKSNVLETNDIEDNSNNNVNKEQHTATDSSNQTTQKKHHQLFFPQELRMNASKDSNLKILDIESCSSSCDSMTISFENESTSSITTGKIDYGRNQHKTYSLTSSSCNSDSSDSSEKSSFIGYGRTKQCTSFELEKLEMQNENYINVESKKPVHLPAGNNNFQKRFERIYQKSEIEHCAGFIESSTFGEEVDNITDRCNLNSNTLCNINSLCSKRDGKATNQQMEQNNLNRLVWNEEYQTGIRTVDSNGCPRTQYFKEWHQVLQLRSYNDELLTILPYVVIE